MQSVITEDAAKAKARAVRARAQELGLGVTHQQAMELMAAAEGEPSWGSLNAKQRAQAARPEHQAGMPAVRSMPAYKASRQPGIAERGFSLPDLPATVRALLQEVGPLSAASQAELTASLEHLEQIRARFAEVSEDKVSPAKKALVEHDLASLSARMVSRLSQGVQPTPNPAMMASVHRLLDGVPASTGTLKLVQKSVLREKLVESGFLARSKGGKFQTTALGRELVGYLTAEGQPASSDSAADTWSQLHSAGLFEKGPDGQLKSTPWGKRLADYLAKDGEPAPIFDGKTVLRGQTLSTYRRGKPHPVIARSFGRMGPYTVALFQNLIVSAEGADAAFNVLTLSVPSGKPAPEGLDVKHLIVWQGNEHLGRLWGAKELRPGAKTPTTSLYPVEGEPWQHLALMTAVKGEVVRPVRMAYPALQVWLVRPEGMFQEEASPDAGNQSEHRACLPFQAFELGGMDQGPVDADAGFDLDAFGAALSLARPEQLLDWIPLY